MAYGDWLLAFCELLTASRQLLFRSITRILAQAGVSTVATPPETIASRRWRPFRPSRQGENQMAQRGETRGRSGLYSHGIIWLVSVDERIRL